MTESDKILTAEYLDWYAKLTGLPSILTDKIRSKLYKRYKKQTGNEPWQLTEVHESEVINSKPEKGPITFEVRPDLELIIKSVLEHFPYLKFRNSFRGIDNYNFVSALVLAEVSRLLPQQDKETIDWKKLVRICKDCFDERYNFFFDGRDDTSDTARSISIKLGK